MSDSARMAADARPSLLRSRPETAEQAGRDNGSGSSPHSVSHLQDELALAMQTIAGRERQISDLLKTLRIVVDRAPDGVVIIDREFRVLLANQASVDQWCQDLGSAAGDPCYRVRHGLDGSCPDCPAARAIDTGLPVSVVREEPGANGHPSRWQVTSYPIKDEYGRVIRVVNFSSNLTKMRWREALGLQAVRLSAVGELAAGIAHEVNNPLTAIIGNAQLLLREFDSSHPARAPLQNIERAGLRASAIVHTLLGFSDRGRYSCVLLDVNTTIEEALGMISSQYRQEGISIVTSLAGDLPQIRASRAHLETTWLNLLLNAREALADRASGEIRIGTERSENGQWVRIYVRDNGRGIPAEDLDRVFDPFFTTKGPNEGVGLGLFMCHTIVTRHKGRIEVDSRPDEGTTFRVSLPVV